MEFKTLIEEKRWDHRREKELYRKWEESGLHEFVFNVNDNREIITIDTPPPYASGKWHVGGAAHYAQIDMIARYFRMKGYNVLVPFYADRNGLPVEVQIEKTYGINAHKFTETPEGREKFLELCKEFLDRIEAELVNIWKKLGCSFNYWTNGTDSVTYRVLTQTTFIELFRKGLIYEDERPVNWCPRCMTTLADAELEYKGEKSFLYYIEFHVKETGEKIVVATTRPELLRSCKAIVYNPGDSRYSRLEGKHAINPLYGHEMIITKHSSVDPDFGTGLVMVCSYGDQTDVRIFRELKLEPEVIVNKDGSICDGKYLTNCLDIPSARMKIVEILEKMNLIIKKEEIVHEIPVCWRCKTPIQIIHSREWFLKQVEFKDKLLELVDKMIFKPEFHKKKLIDWINNVSTDWPISRDRFYATEVPVWKCSVCGSILVPEPGKYYRPWKDPAPWNNCPYCNAPRDKLIGEKKVFDTWFDSSITILYVTGYLRNSDLFERAFKNTIRPQGQDIIRTWLYYSILRVYLLTGKPAFKWIRITGMGLDEKGEAMHKSKGNVIDPEPFIEKYGADAFRFWSAYASKLGYDYRFSEHTIKTGYLFATKLWNIARFISMFPKVDSVEQLRPIDEATIIYLNNILREVDKAYSDLDVYTPIDAIYKFTWNYFASHYIELIKNRAYNMNKKYSIVEQKSAWYTLHYVLNRVLRALAPIMPFITDAIYEKLYDETVHKTKFPEPENEWLGKDYSLVNNIIELNSTIWSFKKKNNIRFSEPLREEIYLPILVKPVIDEIVDLHHLENVRLYVDKPPEKAVNIGWKIYIVK
uniref:Valine--tRNA ligase n=1 Tax=Staphylothermus marinus TaxID=2280 RepID=A0A7C4D6X5_STAMA